MLRIIHLFFLLFIINGCAFFTYTPLDSSVRKNSSLICLNFEGKGRISLKGQKHIFSYETLYKKNQQAWLLEAYFVGHGQERIFFDLKQKRVSADLLNKLSRNDPEVAEQLNSAFELWQLLLADIMQIKSEKNSFNNQYDWIMKKNELHAYYLSKKKVHVNAVFSRPKDNFFHLLSIRFLSQANSEELLGIDLVVRKCLDSNPS